MAVITGVDGRVTIPAGEGTTESALEIFRWSADFQRDIHDVTSFATATNERVKVGGMMHCTGTFEAWYTGTTPVLTGLQDENHAPTAGFELNMEYKGGTGSTKYSFSAILSNISITVEKQGLATITGSFESSGAITVA